MNRPIPTALEAARAIEDGRLTCEGLLAACLERIGDRESSVRAWAHLAAEQALAEARALDRRPGGGPLKGLPFGVKDVIDTADMPTAHGTPIYAGHRPAVDASCVALARTAGAIVLGKTVTTEFAFFQPGPTKNPRNPGHTPGGSSSGSAAAVADGMVPLAIGTQTAGSVIRPAAFCGCVGYKPTFGLLDMVGVRPFSLFLDTLGVFAADVADAAFFASVLAGRPALRVDGRALEAPRIGLCRTVDWQMAEAAMQERLVEAGGRLERAGARVIGIDLPAPFDRLADAANAIYAFEGARANHAVIRAHGDRVSAKVREYAKRGEAISAEEYDAARRLQGDGLAVLDEIMGEVDVLLTPAAPGEAPAGLASTGDPAFSRVWTLLGVPAVAVPFGKGPRGLPLAVQVIGRPGDDARNLAAAAWIERALA